MMVLLVLFQCIYASINVIGWNFTFPTPMEPLLWRISNVMMLGSVFVYRAADTTGFRILPALKRRTSQAPSTEPDPEKALRHKPRGGGIGYLSWVIQRIADAFRNNSPDNDLHLTVPFKAIFPVYFAVIAYCSARAYILLEDFVILRALPPSAFESVSWTGLIPHY